MIWAIAALATAAFAATVALWAPPPSGRIEGASSPPDQPLASRAGARAGVGERATGAVAQRPLSSRAQELGVASRAAPAASGDRARGATAAAAGAAGERFGTPRQKTPAQVALQERVRDRAREIGVELPPDVRQAIDDLQPLPGEDEPAFADRLRDVELDAIEDEFLTEAALWQRYRMESYRVGDPTSHHRAEAGQRVSQMTPQERQNLLAWALPQVDVPTLPHFWPPDQAAPYTGPDAEPPPDEFRWMDPDR